MGGTISANSPPPQCARGTVTTARAGSPRSPWAPRARKPRTTVTARTPPAPSRHAARALDLIPS